MEGEAPSDEWLMAKVKAGDDSALAVLIRRYEGPLYNYARKMLGNASDAEEVFQEAFLRVHLHRNRFWNGSVFKPWVYRIVTNLCKDRLRYRKRRPEVAVSALRRDDGESGYDVLAQTATPTMTPAAAAEASELARKMEQALADLSVKHRAVFLMAHQEGLSYAEIARALRIPTGTVKSRMNKAVKLLLAVMEGTE